ncbi:MAG: hypothetical protein R3F43_19155 [bacterium]
MVEADADRAPARATDPRSSSPPSAAAALEPGVADALAGHRTRSTPLVSGPPSRACRW